MNEVFKMARHSTSQIRFGDAFFTVDSEECGGGFGERPTDDAWDLFLESTPKGQFQQSSGWGRYKLSEGWSVLRVIYSSSRGTVGGFQLLWKATRRGKIAYVSKGPVLDDESWAPEVIRHIQQIVASQGFRAVIVQPPDESGNELTRAIHGAGFIPCSFLGIINSTMLIDLTAGPERLSAQFRSSTRKKRNRALRAGMQVVEGGKKDLPEFFKLMQLTCERQKESPNPPSERSLRALWNSMNAGRQRAYLKFTRLESETVSGDLILLFGNRATLFKTGWNGRHRMLHPNNLRVCEALEWASAEGLQIADFVAFGRDLAVNYLETGGFTDAQSSHRDAFKAGYGGTPKLLPDAGMWIPNPFLRFLLRMGTKSPIVRQKMKGMLR